MTIKKSKALELLRAELPPQIQEALDEADEYTISYALHIAATRAHGISDHLRPQDFGKLPFWLQLHIGELSRFYTEHHAIPKLKGKHEKDQT